MARLSKRARPDRRPIHHRSPTDRHQGRLRARPLSSARRMEPLANTAWSISLHHRLTATALDRYRADCRCPAGLTSQDSRRSVPQTMTYIPRPRVTSRRRTRMRQHGVLSRGDGRTVAAHIRDLAKDRSAFSTVLQRVSRCIDGASPCPSRNRQCTTGGAKRRPAPFPRRASRISRDRFLEFPPHGVEERAPHHSARRRVLLIAGAPPVQNRPRRASRIAPPVSSSQRTRRWPLLTRTPEGSSCHGAFSSCPQCSAPSCPGAPSQNRTCAVHVRGGVTWGQWPFKRHDVETGA